MAKKITKVKDKSNIKKLFNVPVSDNAILDKDKYDKTFALYYDERKRIWKIGPFLCKIHLVPSKKVNDSHYINYINIDVINRGNSNDYTDFALGFNSIGMDDKGNVILHTKFSDAFQELQKSKVNLEKYLKANIDIAVCGTLRPLILEFEKRADGRTVGHHELSID